MQSLSDAIKEIMSADDFDPKYRELMAEVYNDADVKQFIQVNEKSLSKEALVRGEAKLYEFFTQKKNPDDSFAPGYVPALVMNGKWIDVTYQPSQKLSAQRNSMQRGKLVHSISMPKFVQAASFASFDMQDVQRAESISEALNFIEGYTSDSDQYQPGFYLYGNFGVGKTYLLGAIANELAIHGVASTMVHFPSLAVELKNSINDKNVDTGKMVDAIKKSPILMIDDIGADAMSSWIRDDILGVILEYRMQAELPTFFSSNFSMKKLEEEHLAVNQKGDIEQLKAKRIMERIRFLAKEVTLTGENRRTRA